MIGAPSQYPSKIKLIAVNPTRNVRRLYTITQSVDLFGAILVETCWGRIGARGQTKHLSFESFAQADSYIAATLRRRATSATRIGVTYEIVEHSSSASFSRQSPPPQAR